MKNMYTLVMKLLEVHESPTVNIWVNTILNRIDTRAILPKHEDSCMVYRLELYRKQ